MEEEYTIIRMILSKICKIRKTVNEVYTRMKQLLWMGFVVLFAFGVCACGNTQKEENKETEQPTATVSDVSETSSPTPISSDEAYLQAEKMLAGMTLEQKVGQMFLVDLYQLDQKRTLDGAARKLTANMGKALRQYNVGGIYLTELNITDKNQCRQLVDDLQAEAVTGGSLYIAVEEDGGGSNSISAKVAGLNDTGYIAPAEMAHNMTEQQVYEAGKKTGSELTDIGINLNLAPVADIGSENNPDYAKRCLGQDAEQVSQIIDGYVRGMREGGLAVTLKHFPGIGKVAGDYTETVLEQNDSLMSLRNNNFKGYQSGIQAGADCVMVGNVSFSEVTVKKIPAFMSQDIVTKLLRKELKFDGIIMTSPFDDNVIRNNYTYEFATLEAVKAGCDMIVLPEKFKECYHALVSAVKEGKIDERVIDTSVYRILQNKIQRGILVPEGTDQESHEQ